MKPLDAIVLTQGLVAAACWAAAVAALLSGWCGRPPPRQLAVERGMIAGLLFAVGAWMLLRAIFEVPPVLLLLLAASMALAAVTLALSWLGLIGRIEPEAPLPGDAALREELLRRESAEQQLRQALADYRRSAADFEQFAYAASHDLQTPLRNIQGFAQLLDERHGQGLGVEAREFLGYMQQGIAQMQALVESLLQLSRINRQQLVFAHLPLRLTVARASEPLRADIDRLGAEIIAPDLPELSADHGMLAQLLRNLFANALKFQPPGQRPRITVRARREHEHWHLTITDNGIGIPDEQLEQVFAPFRRLHRQDEFDGTGMGLAICRKIAAHHDGDIWAEAHAGGAQIHLLLPARRSLGGDAGPAAPAS